MTSITPSNQIPETSSLQTVQSRGRCERCQWRSDKPCIIDQGAPTSDTLGGLSIPPRISVTIGSRNISRLSNRVNGNPQKPRQTMIVTDAPTSSNNPDGSTSKEADSEHDTLKYHLLGPSLTKAGQDAVDQKKVRQCASRRLRRQY